MKMPLINCTLAMIMSCIAVPVFLYANQDAHQHLHSEKQTAAGKNPLIEEMVKLDGVFREVVSAVSLGDAAKVHAALEPMHGTMEKTHEGVYSGAVRIPKNSDRLDEFLQRDKEFHGNLEALARAAHAGDQQTMLVLTKKLLDECVNCHHTFRN